MGEAKRRKLLNPNYGKLDYIKIFMNSVSTESNSRINPDVLFQFALLFVPENILHDFVEFQFLIQNEDIPREIVEKFPSHYKWKFREFLELDWHESTTNWINHFIAHFDRQESLSEKQKLCVKINLEKAIIVYSMGCPRMFPIEPNEEELEDIAEWKTKVAKSREDFSPSLLELVKEKYSF